MNDVSLENDCWEGTEEDLEYTGTIFLSFRGKKKKKKNDSRIKYLKNFM